MSGAYPVTAISPAGTYKAENGNQQERVDSAEKEGTVSMSDKSGPAYPMQELVRPIPGMGGELEIVRPGAIGLTKRELFAAMAMQGAMVRRIEGETSDSIAAIAVRHADALLAALAEPSKEEQRDE